MSELVLFPWHTGIGAGNHHWEYQALTVLIIAGIWLFFAGLGDRRHNRHKARHQTNPRADTESG